MREFQGILLDLDNTLYPYEAAHEPGLAAMLSAGQTLGHVSLPEAQAAFKKARKRINQSLQGTAASHNRLLYAQHMCEILQLNPSHHALTLYHAYWDAFLDNMKLYPAAGLFLERCLALDKKICLVTDLTAQIQFRKIEKLQIQDYLHAIVTSEEAGQEKPHANMFLLALEKLQLGKDDVVMIGDNFEKDILGARNLNLASYHFAHTPEADTVNFTQLLEMLEGGPSRRHCVPPQDERIDIKSIRPEEVRSTVSKDLLSKMTDTLKPLMQLAKFAGGRFDLVQAGGGNVSWKSPEGHLWIKTSGISLSDMNTAEQCAQLDINSVLAILDDETLLHTSAKSAREDLSTALLHKANLTPSKRPSIETFLHVLMQPFTLHTHPITVNHVVIRADAKDWLAQHFPDAVFVDYATPGIELAIALQAALKAFETKQDKAAQIVFLKNHGLIVSADSADEAEALTQAVVSKIEAALKLDYQHYHLCTRIAALMQSVTDSPCVAHLSEDTKIIELCKRMPHHLHISPTSPDAFVFNGIEPCVLSDLTTTEIHRFQAKHGSHPKVIAYQGHLFFINNTMRKAKEMEDVFKFHLMALSAGKGEIVSLPKEELHYLAGWEAEKFRQKQ